MPDLNDNVNWSEVDSSNNQSPPNGWPAGMQPNQVEPTARAGMGALKRFWDRINGTISTTGSAGAYVYTPVSVSFPTAYVQGETYTFRAHQASVGGDTLNVNGLGAKPIYKPTSVGPAVIAANDIQSGQIVQCVYDGHLGGSGAMQAISGIALLTSINLATNVSGVLAVANGGTAASAAGGQALDNISGFSATGYLKRTGSAAYSFVADGTSHQILHGGGSFSAVDLTADVTNTLPVTSGGSGLSTGVTANHLVLGGGASSPMIGEADWSIDQNFHVLTGNLNAAAAPAPLSSYGMMINGPDAQRTALEIATYQGSPTFRGRRAGNIGALPSQTLSGLALAVFNGHGYGSTGWSSAARGAVLITSRENFSDTAQGTGIDFQTTLVGSTTLVTALSVDATGCAVLGTNTNATPVAGYVGEYKESIISQGSEIGLSDSTPADITSFTLTAGDWEIWGELWLDPNASTQLVKLSGWINSASVTSPTGPATGSSRTTILTGSFSGSGNLAVLPIPACRPLLAASTTYFLSTNCHFSNSTLGAFGKLCARRRA